MPTQHDPSTLIRDIKIADQRVVTGGISIHTETPNASEGNTVALQFQCIGDGRDHPLLIRAMRSDLIQMARVILHDLQPSTEHHILDSLARIEGLLSSFLETSQSQPSTRPPPSL